MWEVERLLQETIDQKLELPQIMVMENVKAIVSTKHKHDFDLWCQFLETIGYRNFWKILNAKDYGIPQQRERCFLISVLGDCFFEFPHPVQLNLTLKDILEDFVDEKFYVNQTQRGYKLLEKYATKERSNEQ